MSTPRTVQRIAIAGMTCAACEAKVGRALESIDGVEVANVSARTGEATLQVERPIDSGQLAAALESAGYDLDPTGARHRAWLTADRSVWRDVAIGIALVVAVSALLWASGALGAVDQLAHAATGGSLILVVLLGVAASLSTCMALTGGLVLSLSARFSATHPKATTSQRLRPQVMFNAGRVLGFTLLGAVLGAAGSLVRFTPQLTAGLMIAAAFVMGLLGLGLTGISPRLATLTMRLPGKAGAWAARKAADDGTDAGANSRPYRDWHALGWGAATFFLPCGFTQAVQVYAAATGSPARAALIMGLFALGTVPALFSAGSLAALARGQVAGRVYRIVGVVVLAFAIVTFTGAITSFTTGTVAGAADAQSTAREGLSPNVTYSGGVQTVRTEHGPDGYQPAVTTIYAGVPVKWIMASTVINCGSSLDLSPFGGEIWTLFPDQDNVYEFTPSTPGDIHYACTMGMITGTFHVIPAPKP